jgi:hypothetical protein
MTADGRDEDDAQCDAVLPEAELRAYVAAIFEGLARISQTRP